MRLLVIGCGSIGMRHAENAVLLGDVAVLDPDDNRRTQAKSREIQTFAELEDALCWRADAVVIATPHDSHMQLAQAAIGRCRAILVEKPFGMDIREMDAVLADAKTQGTAMFGVCNMRYHPAVGALTQHLGEVGEPIFARAHYGNFLPDMRPGVDYRTHYAADGALGGALLDGVHEIDLVQWLLGPASVRHADLVRSGALAIQSNDYAALHLEHESHARSEIHIDYLRRVKLRGLEVTGRDGTILWESVGKGPERARVLLRSKTDRDVHDIYNNDNVDGNAPYREMLSDLVAALNGRDHRLQTATQARAIAAMVLPLLQDKQVK
jgi:predicted dehydrogenase